MTQALTCAGRQGRIIASNVRVFQRVVLIRVEMSKSPKRSESERNECGKRKTNDLSSQRERVELAKGKGSRVEVNQSLDRFANYRMKKR